MATRRRFLQAAGAGRGALHGRSCVPSGRSTVHRAAADAQHHCPVDGPRALPHALARGLGGGQPAGVRAPAASRADVPSRLYRRQRVFAQPRRDDDWRVRAGEESGANFPVARPADARQRVNIGSLLRDRAGYHVVWKGKWHLGFAQNAKPGRAARSGRPPISRTWSANTAWRSGTRCMPERHPGAPAGHVRLFQRTRHARRWYAEQRRTLCQRRHAGRLWADAGCRRRKRARFYLARPHARPSVLPVRLAGQPARHRLLSGRLEGWWLPTGGVRGARHRSAAQLCR